MVTGTADVYWALYRTPINTFTLTLDFHAGPISTNGYSRPNLKVQKKQGM